jgi:hypothetical protein
MRMEHNTQPSVFTAVIGLFLSFHDFRVAGSTLCALDAPPWFVRCQVFHCDICHRREGQLLAKYTY